MVKIEDILDILDNNGEKVDIKKIAGMTGADEAEIESILKGL